MESTTESYTLKFILGISHVLALSNIVHLAIKSSKGILFVIVEINKVFLWQSCLIVSTQLIHL